MNYCAKHYQFYDGFCVYCGYPYIQGTTTMTGVIVCNDCRKTTSGRCPKHSTIGLNHQSVDATGTTVQLK